MQPRMHGGERLRVGLIGCGLIAQVAHLPNLRALPELYEVRALCDLSAQSTEFAARGFPDARRFGCAEELLAEPLDAVFVLTTGDHAPLVVAAAQAGLHVFVEKPLCLSVAEGAEILRAAGHTGVHVMVGYVRRYYREYEELVRRVQALDELQLARVTLWNPPPGLYVQHHDLLPIDATHPHAVAPSGAASVVYPPRSDIDLERLSELQSEDDRSVRQAIGEAASDPHLHRTYRFGLLDGFIHDFNAIRGVLGEPDELRFADIRLPPGGLTAVMRFGEVECLIVSANLPGIARYVNELTFLSPSERLTLNLPYTYLRDVAPTLVTEGGSPGTAHAWRREETISHEWPFRRELVEFHAAITEGREPRTNAEDGLRDVALATQFVRCFTEHTPICTPTDLGHG